MKKQTEFEKDVFQVDRLENNGWTIAIYAAGFGELLGLIGALQHPESPFIVALLVPMGFVVFGLCGIFVAATITGLVRMVRQAVWAWRACR